MEQGTTLADFDLSQAAQALRTGEVTSFDLLEACLQAIEIWEPQVEALVEIMIESAHARAEAADSEIRHTGMRSAVHGIPMMVKDIIDVTGVRTTAGSRILADNIAESDASVVRHLKDAGAIILAKTNTHEFACGGLTPPTRNPWHLGRMTGGSSGGSAVAVAVGESYGALGTDSISSIREPASLCGVVGFKPTFGRVSRHGVIPLAWSLDTVGPIARKVRDCATIFSIVDGHDPSDPSSALSYGPQLDARLTSDLRIAVAQDFSSAMQADISSAFKGVIQALADYGAELEPVTVGHIDDISAATFVILAVEAASFHRPWLETRPDQYGDDVREYLELGLSISGPEYVDAQRLRRYEQTRIQRLIAPFDAMVMPSHVVVAPQLESETVAVPGEGMQPRDLVLVRPLAPFALTGLPAITLPVANDHEGLPISIQVVGHPFRDEELLTHAGLIEELVGWHSKPIPMA